MLLICSTQIIQPCDMLKALLHTWNKFRRHRLVLILAVAISLFHPYPTQAQTPANGVTLDTIGFKYLLTSIGVTEKEKNCLLAFDRSCLLRYYDSSLPGNPLQGGLHNDTLTWLQMGKRFRDSGATALEGNARLSALLYRRAALFFFLGGNAVQCNFAIQSLGFIYDEHLHKYDSSLYFIDLALDRWTQKRDTLGMANLYKYRAYLSTHLPWMTTGIADAHKAIELYSIKKNQFGIMVSYRDLATIFIKKGLTDSANYYLNTAKAFWQSKRDTFRLVGINADLINANTRNKTVVAQLLNETDNYIAKTDINKVMLGQYYDAAINYADKNKDALLKKKYTRLRTAAAAKK
jgi:hypothetical protein